MSKWSGLVCSAGCVVQVEGCMVPCAGCRVQGVKCRVLFADRLTLALQC